MTHQLAGKRILIVEDDYLIAISLADAITAEGGEVVGPLASVDQALSAIANVRVDGAVLNVRLRNDEESYPVADALTLRRIPFLFATGYPELPALYASVPRLPKPTPANQLTRALAQAISRALSAA